MRAVSVAALTALFIMYCIANMALYVYGLQVNGVFVVGLKAVDVRMASR